jgi:hypothetical protein
VDESGDHDRHGRRDRGGHRRRDGAGGRRRRPENYEIPVTLDIGSVGDGEQIEMGVADVEVGGNDLATSAQPPPLPR